MTSAASTATPAEIEVRLFRRRSRQYAALATVMFSAIALIVALTLGVIVLRGQALGPTRVTRMALSWSPAIGYLWALWTLRGMFQSLARDGLSFQPAVIHALDRVGRALGLGAALSLIEGPAVVWLTGGAGPSVGFAAMNVPALTLMVTSLALIALARMLARAARLEAETTRLKAVLEDFI